MPRRINADFGPCKICTDTFEAKLKGLDHSISLPIPPQVLLVIRTDNNDAANHTNTFLQRDDIAFNQREVELKLMREKKKEKKRRALELISGEKKIKWILR